MFTIPPSIQFPFSRPHLLLMFTIAPSDHFFHSLSQPQRSFLSVFISMFSFSAQVKSSLNPVPILLAREFHLQLMFTIPQFSNFLSLFSSPSQPQLSLILSLHTGTTQLSRKGPMTNLMHLLHWTWIANATTNMMHRKKQIQTKVPRWWQKIKRLRFWTA